MTNKSCPCISKTCKRNGNCDECKALHRKKKNLTKCEMDNKKAMKNHTKILTQNRNSWNGISDNWSGTVLPVYGCLCPTEDELHLLPDLTEKKVLEIGCGVGQHRSW